MEQPTAANLRSVTRTQWDVIEWDLTARWAAGEEEIKLGKQFPMTTLIDVFL